MKVDIEKVVTYSSPGKNIFGNTINNKESIEYVIYRKKLFSKKREYLRFVEDGRFVFVNVTTKNSASKYNTKGFAKKVLDDIKSKPNKYILR